MKYNICEPCITRLLMWLFLVPTCSSAQTLTAERQMPCVRDSLEIYKMPYISVGDSGRDCSWDFSSIPVDGAEIISIAYYASSETDTMYMGLHREHANYYYHYTDDTLWLTGYETSHAHIRYTVPIPELHFPFVYGDSASSTFKGKGQYCHIIPLINEGRFSVYADATGRLTLPDMVVDSALRVHSRMDYMEPLHPHIHIKEDAYRWYSPYCRYPLLESVQVQIIGDTDTVSFSSLYYFPQEEKGLPDCEQVLLESIVENRDSLITDVTYLPNPVFGDLNISYTLVCEAQVYISLHYTGGATTYQTPVNHEEEGQHSVSINMSGLPAGSYAVYIHADDTIVSGNVIKL